jgi:hypothetical protein
MTPDQTAAPPWLAVLLLFVGGGIMAVGAGLFPSALAGANAPLWVILAAGACFALAGLAFFAQRWLPKALAGVIPGLLITLFAAIPAWIAFGEGPRQFSVSFSSFGLSLWWNDASLGRIAFGIGAVLGAVIAAYVWSAWWRALPGWGKTLAPIIAALAGWLLFVVMPAEPRWSDLSDDHQRLARYAELGEREGWLRHARRGRPIDWAYPPWHDLEAWSKAARSRLAAARVAPAGATVLTVPVVERAPHIDGLIDEAEWLGALTLPLAADDAHARVRLVSDGVRLYLAGEAPADTTATGYDQFRFWYHLHLSSAMPYERAFLDGTGSVNVMRSAVFSWGGDKRHERTDWYTHRKAEGASRADGYRRYELALDLDEAGLHRGVPFPAFIDIEGDPVLDAAGQFKARTIVGRLGSLEAPIWLRIAR